jgi:hypothetical protein
MRIPYPPRTVRLCGMFSQIRGARWPKSEEQKVLQCTMEREKIVVDVASMTTVGLPICRVSTELTRAFLAKLCTS